MTLPPPDCNSSLRNEKDQQIQQAITHHYYWLDVIRFLAAFAVMACHFRGAFFVEYSLLPQQQQSPAIFSFYFITRLGFEAVLIFFVLSGMLVGGKSIKRISAGNFKTQDYIIDRSVRIMLPLIGSLVLFVPISLYLGLDIPLIDWIGSILSLQGILTSAVFATLWSLSYEVWFYILMCGIAIILSPKYLSNSWKYKTGCIMLVISMLVFSKLMAAYLFIWFLGAFALYKMPKRNTLILIISLILSAFVIVLLQIGSGSHFVSGNIMSTESVRNVLIIVFGLTFAVFLQHAIQYSPHNKVTACINKLGTRLAAFSYTLYLTHVPVLKLLRGLGAPKSPQIGIGSLGLYLLWLVIAMLVAYGVYWLFERNTAVVKLFIKSKLSNTATTE